MLYFASQVSMQSGATHAMVRLAAALKELGQWTMIVAPLTGQDSRQIDFRGVPVSTGPFLSLRGSGFLRNLRWLVMFVPHLLLLLRTIHRNQVDVVHVNEISDILGVVAAKVAGRRCVMHIRADLDGRLISRTMLFAARVFAGLLAVLVDEVIVPSNSVRRRMQELFPVLAGRLVTINDVAFDVEAFSGQVDGAAIRRELGIPPRVPLVLLVSKLSIAKGHLIFLEAAELVAREVADVAFVDAGDVMTDHYWDAAAIRERAVSLLGVADVRMVGYRADLPELIASCDIFVHCPIYNDPFPTVIPIAMMMGKPVVGSDIGGIPEQIANGQTGIIVPPGDAASLAGALLRLIRDQDLRSALSLKALVHAKARYRPEVQATTQLARYRALLS